jgi:pimeloyl-ACP methyl ester carboxylesterase
LARIHVDNLIVDYVEAGTGVPIVFIPGLTEFKEALSFQIRGLQDSYRPISYDLRHGLKRSTDYSLELLVSDLRKFLKALGLGAAVIAGHSFGGLIAMQFALQYPEETMALVLVSSFPVAPEVPQARFLGWISSAGHPFHASLGARMKVQMSRLLGRRTSSALTMEHQVAAVREIAHQASGVPQATINQRMRIIQKTDFRSALPEIVAPTLVMAGANDRAFFLSSAQQLYESIPDSSLEVIEGGGHFCFLTRHDLLNDILDDFLTGRLAEIS